MICPREGGSHGARYAINTQPVLAVGGGGGSVFLVRESFRKASQWPPCSSSGSCVLLAQGPCTCFIFNSCQSQYPPCLIQGSSWMSLPITISQIAPHHHSATSSCALFPADHLPTLTPGWVFTCLLPVTLTRTWVPGGWKLLDLFILYPKPLEHCLEHILGTS